MTDAVVAAPAEPRARTGFPWRRTGIITAQLALLGTILAIWQICTGIAWFRTNTFLDPLSVLDDDAELLSKLERFWGRLLSAARRGHAGPPRGELLEVMARAVR